MQRPERAARAPRGTVLRFLAPRRGEGDVGIDHSRPGGAIDGDRIDRKTVTLIERSKPGHQGIEGRRLQLHAHAVAARLRSLARRCRGRPRGRPGRRRPRALRRCRSASVPPPAVWTSAAFTCIHAKSSRLVSVRFTAADTADCSGSNMPRTRINTRERQRADRRPCAVRAAASRRTRL